jgi:tetratricopeptide (TPR) repeat protein
MAHHLLEAGAAADPDKTWTFVVMAAELARKAAAYEEALTYLDAALALVEDETSVRAGDLHERRADVLRSLGQFQPAAAAYERALDLYDAVGDPVRLAAATFPLTLIHAWNADGRRHLAATTRALDRLPETNLGLRSRVLFLHALGLTTSGDAEGGLAALDEAKRLRAAVDDLAVDTTGAVLEVHVHYQAMQIPLAAAAGRRAMALCVAAGDMWGVVDMQWHQVMAAIYLAKPADARKLIEAARPHAERVGHHNVVWFYRLLASSLALAEGSLDEAASSAKDALALGDEYSIPWNFSSELTLGQVAFYRGDIDAAISHYRRAIVMEPASYWSGLSRAALFAALAQDGHPDALDVLHEVPLRLPVPHQANPFGTWVSLAHIIEGLAWAGRIEDAAALHPAAEALIGTGVKCFRDMRLYRTAAAIAAACAGEWAIADAHFDTALEQAREAPLRIAHAHAQLWRGKLLHRRGPMDAKTAQILLDQAISSFESLGMPTFVAHARQA